MSYLTLEFRKEEVTLQVDGSNDHIIVKGERQTNEQKHVHFELAFPFPPDSDVDNISGNFNREILHMHVHNIINNCKIKIVTLLQKKNPFNIS